MSWVAQSIARNRAESEDAQNVKQWTLHKAKFLSENRHTVWTAFLDQLRRDVAEINGTCNAGLRLEEAPSRTVTVISATGTVTVSMSLDGRKIQIAERLPRPPLGIHVDRQIEVGIDLSRE